MTQIAIINPSDLVAVEIKDQLGSQGIANNRLLLLSANEEEIGTLTDIGGSAAMVQKLTEDTLAVVDTVFFCGPIADCRQAIEWMPAHALGIVLSPDAIDVAPLAVAGTAQSRRETGLLQSPHPAVVQLALLLAPLRDRGIRRIVGTVVQPASIFGGDALDELMAQTRKVLAFQNPAEGTHFDRQIVFNLLPSDDGGQVASQLREVLSTETSEEPQIAVQVVQGGIFHGLSLSLLVELSESTSEEVVRDLLDSDTRIEIVDDLPPGPIESASTDRLLATPPRIARGSKNAFWIWSVMDNLKQGAAHNVLDLAGLSAL